MNVKALVELHKEYLAVSQSLPENFGDGYLCEHNPLYRNIRKKGLSVGATYLKDENTRWYDYMVFPLVNFDELLANKEIPYIDNFNVLQRLSVKHPKLNLPEKFIRDAFKRNYLLHETCHCIAHQFLLDNTANGKKASKSVQLTNSLLGEALANSVELVSSTLATDSAHIFLHVLNSYVPYSPRLQEILQKALGEVGMSVFLKMTFASYFFNNLLGYEHSMENVEKIIDTFRPFFDFDDSKREALSEAIWKGCRLNPRFRDETSVIYFSTFGLGDKYKSLTAETVFSSKKTIENLGQAANQLCDLVLTDN